MSEWTASIENNFGLSKNKTLFTKEIISS